jgi:hypothetical protein
VEAQRAEGPPLPMAEPASEMPSSFTIDNPEVRDQLKECISWLETLIEADPQHGVATRAPMTVLRSAAAGRSFHIKDVTGELRVAQTQWQIGGVASSRYATWAAGFPEEDELIRELRTGFEWDWLPDDKQWQVRALNPDANFKPEPLRPLPAEQHKALQIFVREGLTHGIISLAPESGERTFTNPIFSVPKTDGSRRWVLDSSRMNWFLKQIRFQMTGAKYLSQHLPRGAWVVTADWRKFYWLWRVAYLDRLRQQFWGPDPETGKMQRYMFDVVVMGGGQSMQKTARFPRLLMSKLIKFGADGILYCDESAIWDTSIQLAFIYGQVMLVSGFLLGLPTAYEKFFGIPRQRFELIGLVWETTLLQRMLTQARRLKVQDHFRQVKEHYLARQTVTLRFKSRGVGLLISSYDGVRKAKLKAAPLVRNMSDELRRAGQNYDAKVSLTTEWYTVAVWILGWTAWELWAWMRMAQPQMRLTADASEFGYGGHVMPKVAGGFQIRDFFTAAERTLHHNILEVKAAIYVLVAAIMFYAIRGTSECPYSIAIETDNTMAVKLLSKWMCRCLTSCGEASWLQDFIDLRHIQVRVEFIAGVVMVSHREADLTSRATSKWWDRMLSPAWFNNICQAGGATPQNVIDLFSEASSRQTERFVTREFHPHSLWVDALSRGWDQASNMLIGPDDYVYAFPPERMLGRIAMQLTSGERSARRLILVVPKLTSKSWFLKLHRLSWREPVLIGKMAEVTVAPEGRKDADKRAIPPNWELLAMYISTELGSSAD